MDLYTFIENKNLANRSRFSEAFRPTISAPAPAPKPEPVINTYDYDEELSEVENIRNEAVDTEKLTVKKMRDFTQAMLDIEL